MGVFPYGIPDALVSLLTTPVLMELVWVSEIEEIHVIRLKLGLLSGQWRNGVIMG
jgi:hypothetical protein